MNPIVMDLIIKGLESLPTLIDAGVNIYNRIETIKTLAQNEKDGKKITDEEIATIRAAFDAGLDAFNSPI